MPQTLNLQAKKPDPLGDVGERLREVRQEYGAGSDEYKSVMKEASDLKEEKLREQNAVEAKKSEIDTGENEPKEEKLREQNAVEAKKVKLIPGKTSQKKINEN